MAHMVQTHDGMVLRDDWFIEDVESRLEDNFNGLVLTEAECLKVLEYVADSFDATVGISWDSIDEAIEALFGDRMEVEE